MSLQSDIQKTRDFYAMKKGAKILQHEFGFFVIDRWINEGHVSGYAGIADICGFDGMGIFAFGDLGWCEPPLVPVFEEKILEDRGEHEGVLISNIAKPAEVVQCRA